ncbi:MAG: LysR family transcriptional regulator [Pseudomonadaceae bacterium]|nr:LysR family transcriptional regulator [Pseudomonadaceae bacterium]
MVDKFNALATLVCVVEQNSFSRAAEQLGKTPSAVAKAIAALEAELGTRLFERTTRRMQLTEAGRLYAQATREALGCLGNASEEIGQMQYGLHGELRIASAVAFGSAFLAEVCAAFCLAHPQLRLQVDLSDNDQFILESGHDLILHEGACNTPGLIVRPVGKNHIVLSASPAYLARNPLPVNPQTLQQHDWLMYKHPALGRHYWTLWQQGEALRVEQPQPRILSDNYDFLLANAVAGAGLLITPWWSAAPYLADGRLVRLMADYELDPDAFGPHILAVYPSHRRATHKVQVFIQFLEAFLRERGYA